MDKVKAKEVNPDKEVLHYVILAGENLYYSSYVYSDYNEACSMYARIDAKNKKMFEVMLPL